MPSTPAPDSNSELVRDRLRARARRVSVIRRRVVAAALATFVLAFGLIAGTGSLGSTSTASSSPHASSSSSPSSSPSSTSSQGSGSSVTTSQS